MNNEEYIDQAKKNINFFLSCKQWSGLNKSKINSWIENFPDDEKVMYFVHKLLNQIIYYSESDLKQMLFEGVFHRVLTNAVLKEQIKDNFIHPQHSLDFKLKQELKKTLFVPLLDAEAPYESGNQVTRILTQQLGVPTNQVVFSRNINSLHEHYERLIILDDCIGSGDQFRTFWEESIVNSGESLREWCQMNKVEAHYVVLVGYEDNINGLSVEMNDLQIHCVELLKEENRVFSNKSAYWENENEMNEAKKLFQEIVNEYGIPLLGYRDMDFAIIMHLNIPDWSLPVFWKSAPGWDILIERKNSHG
ncbi:phosphoribosyltransferase-like protein [Bacillus sp. FSL K6-0067]|uniref:phosphoribosyltransferase-like protein n=1 Tax=Bacillus sp. FSL K6-0067 TaxID=2921412 RepID=UPI00077A705E|nr:hypothetical protein [Bacillus cereus]KXY34997.1 hypothetical protein AT267_21835 [Bacillus cereus]